MGFFSGLIIGLAIGIFGTIAMKEDEAEHWKRLKARNDPHNRYQPSDSDYSL